MALIWDAKMWNYSFASPKDGKTMENQSTIAELWEFLRTRKRYWLAPIVLVLILLGALIVFTESSAVAPFVYALF
jgi:hypothetical protein